MTQRSNQNCTFPKMTCCTKHETYRCCIRVSNTHVLYDALYLHTYERACAIAPTLIRAVSLVRQKLKKSRKKDNSLQRNIFTADKLTKKYTWWPYATSVERFSTTVLLTTYIISRPMWSQTGKGSISKLLIPWTFFVSLANPSNRSSRFHALKRSIYTWITKPSCINYTDPLVYFMM
jgi:hypothetical protein